jgi:hypothetical protein
MEQEFTFVNGEMVEVTPQGEKKIDEKEWFVNIIATPGTKTFTDLTRIQARKLLRCLQKTTVPFDYFVRLKPAGYAEVSYTIREGKEYSIEDIKEKQAKMLADCLKPLQDYVKTDVGKKQQQLEEVI